MKHHTPISLCKHCICFRSPPAKIQLQWKILQNQMDPSLKGQNLLWKIIRELWKAKQTSYCEGDGENQGAIWELIGIGLLCVLFIGDAGKAKSLKLISMENNRFLSVLGGWRLNYIWIWELKCNFIFVLSYLCDFLKIKTKSKF